MVDHTIHVLAQQGMAVVQTGRGHPGTKKKQEEEFISKEEILAGIDAGLKDLKAGRKQSFDSFIKEMKNEL